MIKTVYLDMDEVITDFNAGVCRQINLPYPPKTYDFFEDVRLQVNDFCTTEFWANLDWTPDGHDILRLVTSTFKPEQIYLLTIPMPNPGSYTGKALWVQRHLPEYSKRLIVTPAPKSLFARPDTLLIDDKDENVEGFVKAGGNAILVPRPWNELHGWANETYQVVKNSLENFK